MRPCVNVCRKLQRWPHWSDIIRFTMENILLMRLNQVEHRGMKSSTIPRQDRQKPERKGNGKMPRCPAEGRRPTSGRNLPWFDQVAGVGRWAFSTSESEAANKVHSVWSRWWHPRSLRVRSYIQRVHCPRIPIYAPAASSEASFIDWTSKPTSVSRSLCSIRIVAFHERWSSCDLGGKWPCTNWDFLFATVPRVFRTTRTRF